MIAVCSAADVDSSGLIKRGRIRSTFLTMGDPLSLGLAVPAGGAAGSDFVQRVRLFDVFFLGPFMVWFAARARGVPSVARWLMGGFGVTTILFNAAGYIARSGARRRGA